VTEIIEEDDSLAEPPASARRDVTEDLAELPVKKAVSFATEQQLKAKEPAAEVVTSGAEESAPESDADKKNKSKSPKKSKADGKDGKGKSKGKGTDGKGKGAKSQSSSVDAAKKSPPPPMSKVVKTAASDLAGGAKDAAKAGLSIAKVATHKGHVVNIHLEHVLWAIFFGFIAFQLLLVKLINPSPWFLWTFMFIGIGIGLAFSFLYYQNKKEKAEVNSVLCQTLGLKGIQQLLGTLPTWLSYTETEKIEWLNTILEEVWPFVDRGVCKMVKEITENIFEEVLKVNKVPGIRSIGFKQLTFGDAPFRVESIWVNEDGSEGMEMEVGVRWCGEANITLAIELSMGEFTKCCPRVTDISFSGLMRVRLNPLVDKIPGFGAALVTFRKPPRYKYSLDFGKAFGGPYMANVVKPFVNMVINQHIVNTLVWPQRMVIPIIYKDPEVQPEIDAMQYRSKGMIKVTVNQATNLKGEQTAETKKSDACVEFWTDGSFTPETATIKHTSNPKWEETYWLLVQEPMSQEMRVVVNDRSFFSAKELLSLRVTQTFGAKTLIGRASVKIKPAAMSEPEPYSAWYHLGEGDWAASAGCGKGKGKIQFTMIYRSLENFRSDEPSNAEMGVLICQVFKCTNLSHSREIVAYARMRCGEEVQNTGLARGKKEHNFNVRNIKEFYNVRFDLDVKVKVIEKTLIAEDFIGVIEVTVADISQANDFNPLTGKKEWGFLRRAFKLDEADQGEIHVALRYVPYF